MDRIRYIILPALGSTFAVLLILSSGSLLSSNFDLFYLLTTPTNTPKMDVFAVYAYRYGFKLMRFSYATAISMLTTVVSLVMLVMVNRICKKLVDKNIF